MYLPNILVVYTLIKNIFYLESIKSYNYLKTYVLLLYIFMYLIYFRDKNIVYHAVMFLRYICSILR